LRLYFSLGKTMRILVALITYVLLTSMATAGYYDRIPDKAYKILPLIAIEANAYKTPFDAAIVAAAVEQESCIHLDHPRCYSPTSSFKTRWSNGRRREEGGGLLMLTRTWTRSGRIRFDTLTRLTRRYRTHLKGLSWRTLYTSPQLQVRAGIFLMLDNYHSIPKSVPPCEKIPMILSSYNQGMGGLKQDRRICGLKKGCNPNKWFGNVEQVKRSYFATKILYGRRTAWQINRKHVELVLKKRLPKYRNYFKSKLEGE